MIKHTCISLKINTMTLILYQFSGVIIYFINIFPLVTIERWKNYFCYVYLDLLFVQMAILCMDFFV